MQRFVRQLSDEALIVRAPELGTGPVPALDAAPRRAHRGDGGEQLTADEYAAWRGFLRTYQALLRVLDEELTRDAGVPLPTYDVLVQLSNAGGRLRMRDLAGRLLVSRSGATRLIDRVERDGLVTRERCRVDGRGQYAVLTQAGAEVLEAARPTHLAGLRERLLEPLDDEQLLGLGSGFARVLRRLERETGEPLL